MWKTFLKNCVCIHAFLKAETKWVFIEIKFDIKKIYIYAIPPPSPAEFGIEIKKTILLVVRLGKHLKTLWNQ